MPTGNNHYKSRKTKIINKILSNKKIEGGIEI